MNKIKNFLISLICSSLCCTLGYTYSQATFKKRLVDEQHAEYNQKSGDWQLKPFSSKANEASELFVPLFPNN
jgi:hypothetical protein